MHKPLLNWPVILVWHTHPCYSSMPARTKTEIKRVHQSANSEAHTLKSWGKLCTKDPKGQGEKRERKLHQCFLCLSYSPAKCPFSALHGKWKVQSTAIASFHTLCKGKARLATKYTPNSELNQSQLSEKCTYALQVFMSMFVTFLPCYVKGIFKVKATLCTSEYEQ